MRFNINSDPSAEAAMFRLPNEMFAQLAEQIDNSIDRESLLKVCETNKVLRNTGLPTFLQGHVCVDLHQLRDQALYARITALSQPAIAAHIHTLELPMGRILDQRTEDEALEWLWVKDGGDAPCDEPWMIIEQWAGTYSDILEEFFGVCSTYARTLRIGGAGSAFTRDQVFVDPHGHRGYLGGRPTAGEDDEEYQQFLKPRFVPISRCMRRRLLFEIDDMFSQRAMEVLPNFTWPRLRRLEITGWTTCSFEALMRNINCDVAEAVAGVEEVYFEPCVETEEETEGIKIENPRHRDEVLKFEDLNMPNVKRVIFTAANDGFRTLAFMASSFPANLTYLSLEGVVANGLILALRALPLERLKLSDVALRQPGSFGLWASPAQTRSDRWAEFFGLCGTMQHLGNIEFESLYYYHPSTPAPSRPCLKCKESYPATLYTDYEADAIALMKLRDSITARFPGMKTRMTVAVRTNHPKLTYNIPTDYANECGLFPPCPMTGHSDGVPFTGCR